MDARVSCDVLYLLPSNNLEWLGYLNLSRHLYIRTLAFHFFNPFIIPAAISRSPSPLLSIGTTTIYSCRCATAARTKREARWNRQWAKRGSFKGQTRSHVHDVFSTLSQLSMQKVKFGAKKSRHRSDTEFLFAIWATRGGKPTKKRRWPKSTA